VRQSESVTASKALELRAIDLIAEDVPELLRKIDGRRSTWAAARRHTLRTASAEIRDVPWAVKEQVLHLLPTRDRLPDLHHRHDRRDARAVPPRTSFRVVGGICLLVRHPSRCCREHRPCSWSRSASGSSSRRCTWRARWVRRGRPGLRGDRLAAPGRHVDKSFYADADFGLGWRIVGPVGAAMAVIAGTLAGSFGQRAPAAACRRYSLIARSARCARTTWCWCRRAVEGRQRPTAGAGRARPRPRGPRAHPRSGPKAPH